MIEFLTENARRAYPLEREWPAGLDGRWAETLVDACVYAAGELGDKRVSLLSVERSGSSLVFTVGIPDGVAMDVAAPSGHAGFATVHAESAALKAILTVDGRKVSALVAAGVTGGTVGVPFATRCCGGAVRRVTAITAQGAAPCARPTYDPDGPHAVERSVGANEHCTLAAKDGVDLEVTSVAPLAGEILRVSAIAAPSAAETDEEPVDLMIRGDECFTVEAIPGVKVADGGAIVPRTPADGSGGVVRIGSACKPCCQCEDYKDAVDLLKPAEREAWDINGQLDRVEADYQAALAVFNAAKALQKARINDASNVYVSATASLSGGMYGRSKASGERKHIAVTLLVANMTMVDATVTVADDATQTVNGAAVPVAGFHVPGYRHVKTTWTRAGATPISGQARPGSRTLKPGETLAVTTVYGKTATTNDADRPSGMKAFCTIQLPGQGATTRGVDVK